MGSSKILSFHRILASIWFVDPPFYDSSRPTRRYMMDRWGEYIPPPLLILPLTTPVYLLLRDIYCHIVPHTYCYILVCTDLEHAKNEYKSYCDHT